MLVPIKNIPTFNYETNTWSKTSFNSQKEFGDFLYEKCFKDCGLYQFNNKYTKKWNEQSTAWTLNKRYTDYALGTPEYNEYWDDQELKCRLGVLWIVNDNLIWYTTRDYYFLLNFCPIINKEVGYTETFATPRDGQYHMMLYEKIAEIKDKHSCVLKRRQFLYSYCHVAKSINYLWFENRKRIKWFASDDKYIDDVDGSWSILNQYKTHINNHTDWQREFTPDKGGEIRQRQQIKTNGKWEWEGSESSIVANTLNKDPKKGVGGPCFYAWHEEGGIAPKANITLQYMEPALSSGLSRVGSFSIGGSVGDLSECDPLKNFMKNPNIYGFFAVPTKWYDDTGVVENCGLFIPAQYSMPEATDEHGNSLVELALELLHKAEFHGFKAGEYGRVEDEPAWIKLPIKDYILKKSQSPKNIKEAFDWRDASEFDAAQIQRRQQQITLLNETNGWDFTPIKCMLYRDIDGKIQYTTKNLPEEIIYPVQKELVDKRGVTILYELPEKNAPMYTYFAGVDPVAVGATTTSKSVFSISIWKKPVEKVFYDENGKKQIEVTGEKMVACWRGRYDTPDKTNEYAELLIRYYTAYTLAERNIPNFINHFMRKNLTHLLAREDELPLFKDQTNRISGSQYGFHKGSQGNLAKIFGQFKEKFKEYMDAEYGTNTLINKEGEQTEEIVKTFKGIDRIDDYWFLEELKLYNDDNADNFDRIVSDFAGYYIMSLYTIHMGTTRIKDNSKAKKITKTLNNYVYNFTNSSELEYDYTSY